MPKSKPFLRGRGTCIFCKRSPPEVKMTGEHIWSDWLKNILPSHHFRTESSSGIYDKHGRLLPEKKDVKRPGAVHRRQTKVVCKSCNGGWMKAIVDCAKPFAEKLIKGEPVSLDFAAQTALANWMALSSISVKQETASRHRISETDLQYMYKHHLAPPHWRFEIGRYYGGGGSHFRDRSFPVVGEDTEIGEITTTLFVEHSTATILGHLYIKFYGPDPPDSVFAPPLPPHLHRPFLIPIWPTVYPAIPFPPPPQFFIYGKLKPRGGGIAWDLSGRVFDWMQRGFERAGLRPRPH